MSRHAAAAKPKRDIVETFDVQQRSEEWLRLRMGIPTASRFATVMASGKDGDASRTRAKLMRQLAGERLSDEPAVTFRNESMQRGIDWEPDARAYYARTRFVDLTQVGFVRRTIHNQLGIPIVVGCSPDSLIGRKRALEIKTVEQEALIEILDGGAAAFPSGHRAQCQGTMWVADLDEIDLMIYSRGMPTAAIFRLERDDGYIHRIREEIERFDFELRQMVDRMKNMGRAQ